MKLLVVGSVAYDTVKTPFGERERILGGSATYFGVAASYFTDVAVLAVVGEDFCEEDREVFRRHKVDIRGLDVRPGAKTFHWQGEYGYDLNDAQTLRTDLNVLLEFDPKVPEELRSVPYLFLANIDPLVQLRVLDQVPGAQVVAADTMNYWIDNRPKELLEVLSRIHILMINEAEARQLSQEFNLVRAARKILGWGPKMLIIKRGEYGVLKVTADSIFAAPAYPLESVFDPTGAGDTFAGGFMGYVASQGNINPETLRQAMVMGSVMASFDVEDFSLGRLTALDRPEIEQRYHAFRRLTEFSDL
jgi:sugar/nucleoside kinase (ribokinase family)